MLTLCYSAEKGKTGPLPGKKVVETVASAEASSRFQGGRTVHAEMGEELLMEMVERLRDHARHDGSHRDFELIDKVEAYLQGC
ncbi:hypothetical protein [Rhodanobacter sp. C03]|uniref:hypothetical protein n=1 Tax=Rhodanobacter sp. C03 TaxID=1945858 RepID=UPI001115597E|nr:hypothetical protein [Rhodanobacter sp. C03]